MAYDNDENDGLSWSNIAAGAAIGLAVGTVVGLLIAPKSGDETRADIRDKAEGALDELQTAASTLSTRARELTEQTKVNFTESIEAGKSAYAAKRDELTARLDREPGAIERGA